MSTPNKFRAHWIATWEQDEADAGQEPVYGWSDHATFAEAEAAAIAKGRAAGVCEWASVTEHAFTKASGWSTVAKWTGDWEQLEDAS